MISVAKDEEANMKRLKQLSLCFVALLSLLFCSLFGLFFPVEEDFWLGFGSDKFDWGKTISLTAFANLPDMVNTCVYLTLRYKLVARAAVDTTSDSTSVHEEYYHGIYMGPPPSNRDLDMILPGQVEIHGPSAVLEQKLSNPPADSSSRASLPNPPSAIESLAMRALLTHVLASFTDIILVPVCIVLTEPGAMRETAVLSAIIVMTYLLPVVVALSTLGKFRMVIKEVLFEMLLFCH